MNVAIVGIGIHPFGRHLGISSRRQAVVAVHAALHDACLRWPDIEFAVGGSSGHSDIPDTLVKDLGLTGLPFTNVTNACATGGSALISAATAIESGTFELGMVIGFDQHPPGAFSPDPRIFGLGSWYGEIGLMVGPQFFAQKIQRYMFDYGIGSTTLAKVANKALRNGAENPHAWRRKVFSEDEILSSPMICHPLTQYMFCSPTDGAVAVVLCGAERAGEFTDRPVYLRSATLRSRRFGSFEAFSPSVALDPAESPSVDAARAAFELAGVGPNDIDVAQLQDTESGAEVMHLAECGFCPHGAQEDLIKSGQTEISGSLPVNTDGGCLANGEPVGASGLRQVYENVLQLRGAAGRRQVQDRPRTAFTHVYGAPGVSACTVLVR